MGHLIGYVTGLAAEARLLRGNLVAWGKDPEANARRLLARGADRLVSFGIAGGLDPALPPGTLVVATEVIGDGERFPAQAWGCGKALRGAIAGSGHPLASPAAKARLYAATRAVAVDMESLAVARVAAEAGVPFMALRAIADPADRAVPGLALSALDAQGRPDLLRLAAGVLTDPEQIPQLWRLALDYRAALGALRAERSRSNTDGHEYPRMNTDKK